MSKGITCKCGTYHQYGAYVFAHYDEYLTFTCPDCGRKYRIIQFDAELVPEKAKRNVKDRKARG